MNKQRRKTLQEIAWALASLREQLEEVLEEEAKAYENMPESIRTSYRGNSMADGMETLSSCINDLEDIEDQLQDINYK